MKLDEYSKTRIPAKFSKIVFDRSTDKYTIEGKLKKLGWTLLGAGYYSTVYSNPKKSYVLKVNDRQDTAYAQYVSLIKKYNNKHFPKISDLKFIEVNGGRYYIYLIEKLDDVRSEMKHLANVFSEIIDCPYSSLTFFNTSHTQLDYLKQNPELVTALRIIGKFKHNIKNPYISNDMHGGNIMQRKDGTIVITDPYAS